MKRAMIAAAMLSALSSPVLADPNCLGGGQSGLRVEWGVNVGGKFTAQEQMQFDVMNARRNGIDAETAERTWLGCLKITRRGAGGGWITEYYDPSTFQLKPLNLNLPDR